MVFDYLLIIASSARMLAQAAKNTGLKPLVIDLYADLDTQSCAVDFQQISTLSIAQLSPALDYFVHHYRVTHIIYGSGFEQHPESLNYLAQRFTLLGNSPDTFNKLLDKAYFFATLKEHNIPYPETSFTPPTDTKNWLIKPLRGHGGVGIHYWSTNLGLYSDVYWQKYQHGTQHSVLFLADGRNLQIIGFNTQWTIRLSDSEEFIFSGIINHCPLMQNQQMTVIDWLTKLVPVFQLKGLNSLDFIHNNGNSVVLEINPRPPASMQLYEANLLQRHIMTTRFSKDLPPQSDYTGYQIIYAEQTIQIPANYHWENGVMDIPVAGAICHTGQPICSIIAHQSQAHAVLHELTLKQHIIKKGLYTHGKQRQR